MKDWVHDYQKQMDCLFSFFENEENYVPPTVQILALEWVVSAIVGVEKEMEWEVQMLEGPGHQVANMDKE